MKKLTILVAAMVAVALATGSISAGAAAPSKKASPLDQAWIEEAVRIDLSEISAGKLAMKQGQSAKVTQLGKRLSAAHTKAIVADKARAKQVGAGVPTHLTANQKAVAKKLESATGAAFDTAYTEAEVKGHMEAIKGAKLEIANGTSAVVVQAAKTNLKMYEMHLKWARAATNAGGAM
jgi:putative membrane protein